MTTSAKPVRGTVDSCPCPHCGTKMDLRTILETVGGLMDRDSAVSCDKCHRLSQILSVKKVTVVTLRQMDGQRPPDGSSMQGQGTVPTTAMSRPVATSGVRMPAVLQRLFNRRR